jgi:4-diphosphocytidyl-2-C-methyl-D-erythritol kinase
MPTTVRSHAKINLGLGIGAPRRDGFHALTTVYQTVEAHDLVTVSARAAEVTALRITSNDRRVPRDGRNTAWKMVELALKEMGLAAEVEIHIEKNLPVQGGLGAGSANAVAALVGLEVELEKQGLGTKGLGTEGLEGGGQRSGGGGSRSRNAGPSTSLRFAQDDKDAEDDNAFDRDDRIRLKIVNGFGAGWPAKRLEIAANVGSDVPLFLIGGTVLGVDRGQEVYPLPDIEPVWCMIATPAEGVSTPQAFRDWDALCAAEGLTAQASADKLNMLSRAYASAFAGGIPGMPCGAGSSGVLPEDASMGEDLAGPVESALVRTGITSWIQNDFERVVFPQHPSLAEIKRLLAGGGSPEAAGPTSFFGASSLGASCLGASLSGSGSALFGLYLTREAAEAARARLKQVRSIEVGSLLTRTLPRSSYWQGMLEPQVS